MAFAYDPKRATRTTDPESGVTISLSDRFTDADDALYDYRDDKIQFDFRVRLESEKRPYQTKNGREELYNAPVTAYLGQWEIENDFLIARSRASLPRPSDDEMALMLEAVRAGLSVLLTHGGAISYLTPDFRVVYRGGRL
jgi:hypothetical protein